MVEEAGLLQLIGSLRKATSVHEQLRILIRSWRLIRTMRPDERLRVARHVGLAETERLLERLGQPHGISPARLLRAVEQAEKANTVELAGLVGSLRKREQRGKAIDTSLRLVDEMLTRRESRESPVTPPPPVGTRRDSEVVREIAPGQESPEAEGDTVVRSEVSEPAPEVLPSKGLGESEEPKERAVKRDVVVDERRGDKELDESSLELSPAAAEAELKEAECAVESPGEVKPEVDDGVKTTPKAARFFDESLAESLRRERSLIRRFRCVRQHLAEGIPIDDPETILEAFDAGWMKRRVLSSLILAGAVDRDSAVKLIEKKISRIDQLFCVSTLLCAFEFSSDELANLSLRKLSGASRRLLRQKLHLLRDGGE